MLYLMETFVKLIMLISEKNFLLMWNVFRVKIILKALRYIIWLILFQFKQIEETWIYNWLKSLKCFMKDSIIYYFFF